jgi:hypothetical protein
MKVAAAESSFTGDARESTRVFRIAASIVATVDRSSSPAGLMSRGSSGRCVVTLNAITSIVSRGRSRNR